MTSKEEHQDGGKEGEVIDIEEYVKENKPIPQGKAYQIRIDKTKYIVHVVSMTGRQLLELAGKKPLEQYRIYQKLKGGQSIEIPYEQSVDFTQNGVERFITLAIEQTEG